LHGSVSAQRVLALALAAVGCRRAAVEVSAPVALVASGRRLGETAARAAVLGFAVESMAVSEALLEEVLE